MEAFPFTLWKEVSAWNISCVESAWIISLEYLMLRDDSYVLDAYKAQIRPLYSQSGYSESRILLNQLMLSDWTTPSFPSAFEPKEIATCRI